MKLLFCLPFLLASAAVADGFDVTGQVLGVNRSEWGWILLADDVRPNNFNVYGRETIGRVKSDLKVEERTRLKSR